jgi:hypothetical protein
MALMIVIYHGRPKRVNIYLRISSKIIANKILFISLTLSFTNFVIISLPLTLPYMAWLRLQIPLKNHTFCFLPHTLRRLEEFHIRHAISFQKYQLLENKEYLLPAISPPCVLGEGLHSLSV